MNIITMKFLHTNEGNVRLTSAAMALTKCQTLNNNIRNTNLAKTPLKLITFNLYSSAAFFKTTSELVSRVTQLDGTT